MYLQEGLGGFSSLSPRLAISGSLGKKKHTEKVTNDASERKINPSELIPEIFFMPSSPLADQTPPLLVLALASEAVLEFKRGEAEKCIGWLVELSSCWAGWGCLCVQLGWVTAKAEVMITLCTWLFLSALIQHRNSTRTALLQEPHARETRFPLQRAPAMSHSYIPALEEKCCPGTLRKRSV